MLKIYTYDLGYRGGLVVTAHSLGEAHDKLMASSDEYRTAIGNPWENGNEELEEHDLEGFSHDFYGDR
jgi:hypothetical protein